MHVLRLMKEQNKLVKVFTNPVLSEKTVFPPSEDVSCTIMHNLIDASVEEIVYVLYVCVFLY